MRILAIETSFDEAGLAVIEYSQEETSTKIKVLSDTLFSQAELHVEYGGVYPSLAKQVHAKNLTSLFAQTLKDAGLHKEGSSNCPEEIKEILKREPEMYEELKKLLSEIQKPEIDRIAITRGPGLEPALWVGITFAKALSIAWDIPLSPVNHMEGHIAAALAKKTDGGFIISPPNSPSLALLISGAHTELVLMKEYLQYERIGSTRDDAVGEAFDKTARLLGLQYPGGPKISKLASLAREEELDNPYTLPRPMINSDDYDFSLSGLKTAVRNLVEEIGEPSEEQKKQIAREFEDSVTDVLISKTKKAIEEHGIRSLIVSGGVAANSYIREKLESLTKEYENVDFYIPTPDLSTDNGRMIAFACAIKDSPIEENVVADGNLKLY
ncbi:tRNA (adenosine(37)-N6)-threonylcarbamoyltransferase complex transferase subunit TsaD [Candidatus Kaiserbacteria bacterium]|nr:MAG: tRNA (adenosine(37)-N6)-threonylcarbamoyltransferase complex transferase subunit TsaD [Candidatus Kaiserbacteria bacterium]